MVREKKIVLSIIALLFSVLSSSQHCSGDVFSDSIFKDGEVILDRKCEMIGCYCTSNWVVVRSKEMCKEQLTVLDKAQVLQVQSSRFLFDTSLKFINLQNLMIQTKSKIDVVNDPRLINLRALYVTRITENTKRLRFDGYTRLTDLTILDISNSTVSTLPESLCSLYIGETTSIDSILVALNNVQDLKSLDIEFKRPRKYKIPASSSFPITIEEFATNAIIDSASIDVITRMKNLKKLTIFRLDLLEKDFEKLSNLSYIESILLSRRGLSKSDMEKIRLIMVRSGHTVSFY